MPRTVTSRAVRSYRTLSPLPLLLRVLRRSTLCCTFRRLAPPRRYLALCPMEPGLSSPMHQATLKRVFLVNTGATVGPTPRPHITRRNPQVQAWILSKSHFLCELRHQKWQAYYLQRVKLAINWYFCHFKLLINKYLLPNLGSPTYIRPTFTIKVQETLRESA